MLPRGARSLEPRTQVPLCGYFPKATLGCAVLSAPGLGPPEPSPEALTALHTPTPHPILQTSPRM